MASTSFGPGYLFGTAFLGIGTLGLVNGAGITAQETFGVLLANPSAATTNSSKTTTPQIEPGRAYLLSKAGRDIALGAMFFHLEYLGNEKAVAALLGIVSFCGYVDGYAVKRYATGKLQEKAWGHWGGSLFMTAYAVWKLWSS